MTTRRTSPLMTLAAAFGLVTSLAGAARAGDFCLDWKELGFIPDAIVGKGFRVPPPGRCKPFLGIGLGLTTVSGSACSASDGSRVRFNLTRMYPTAGNNGSGVYFYDVDLPLPLGASGTIYKHRLPMSVVELPYTLESIVTGGPCTTTQTVY